MKSTYKLLNIFLDGQPVPSKIPRLIDAADALKCWELEDETNIFDFPVCRRKISGMKLLSYQSKSDILDAISALPNCKELIIILDYNSIGKAAQKLYIKRILQISYLIMKDYPDIIISFVNDDVSS